MESLQHIRARLMELQRVTRTMAVTELETEQDLQVVLDAYDALAAHVKGLELQIAQGGIISFPKLQAERQEQYETIRRLEQRLVSLAMKYAVCLVCWTNSFEPCEPTDKDAVKREVRVLDDDALKDVEYVRCLCCWQHDTLAAAQVLLQEGTELSLTGFSDRPEWNTRARDWLARKPQRGRDG